MRSTGDEVDIGARAVERGTDVGADRSGAEDCDFHENTPFGLRDTAEVTAVRLMSTKYCLQYGGWGDKGPYDDRSAQVGYRSSHTVDAPSSQLP
ncbi:hypothetical protein SSP24_09480 [Streptomyces spinoverrucosus]|uniref:Uncharacterized protein n=1 Tax=Streptomyces spinoverrucosus TaxID=284043 RepID=A0A4Y3VA93_9ACTN|nr:hypothetical protein SSP24_09480 [Streptomyces spinoverrucosus]GHB36788.1 hypothetical protein GCM10010397_03090 [Streptomyces spinoverrucosus]